MYAATLEYTNYQKLCCIDLYVYKQIFDLTETYRLLAHSYYISRTIHQNNYKTKALYIINHSNGQVCYTFVLHKFPFMCMCCVIYYNMVGFITRMMFTHGQLTINFI